MAAIEWDRAVLFANSAGVKELVMKRFYCFFWLGLGAAGLALAGSAPMDGWRIDAARLGMMSRGTVLIGKPVKTSDGHKAGQLQDLLLDLPSGRVEAVMVSVSRHEVVPVPAQCLAFASQYRVILEADKRRFQQAPRCEPPRPGSGLDARTLGAALEYFAGTQPQLSTGPAGGWSSAESLLGAPVAGARGEPLGKVKDLMLDVPAGQMVYVVVEPGPGAAGPDDLYVVPPVCLTVQPASRSLKLKLTQDAFLAGPHFSRQFWTDMIFPEMAMAVCKHYGLHAPEPTQSGGLSASSSQAVPVETGRSDQEITRAVLAELLRDSHGQLIVLNLAVTTRDGRVTLSGQVKDETEKRQVLGAAQRAAGQDNVEDRIETQREKRSKR